MQWKDKKIVLAKAGVFSASLIPLLILGRDAWQANLGANPIETITHTTGEWGLRFLVATLALTPIRLVSGWNVVLRFRRMLGLFAFFYAFMHLSTYLVLDQFFVWEDIVEDILKRPYITLGMGGFLCMLPLALTSTRGAITRLGGRRWRQLHRLSYVAGVLGVVHFLWLVKADHREPLIYLGLLLLLFLIRFRYRKKTPRSPRAAQ